MKRVITNLNFSITKLLKKTVMYYIEELGNA